MKVIRFVETDEQGRFKMDGLEWGSYIAYAMKESEGYPNTRWSIYASGSPFSVDLSPQAPNAYVEIGVGPKAGIVDGTIADAVTGKPVSNPGIHIWRWRQPGDELRTSEPGQFTILIPPETQVGFEADAPGYKPWYYPGPATPEPGNPMVMKSNERMSLDIKLQPLQ